MVPLICVCLIDQLFRWNIMNYFFPENQNRQIRGKSFFRFSGVFDIEKKSRIIILYEDLTYQTNTLKEPFHFFCYSRKQNIFYLLRTSLNDCFNIIKSCNVKQILHPYQFFCIKIRVFVQRKHKWNNIRWIEFENLLGFQNLRPD